MTASMYTRWFLFAVLLAMAATHRVAFALSRNSIRTHLPDSSSISTTTTIGTARTSTTTAATPDGRVPTRLPVASEHEHLDRKQALKSMASGLVASGVLAATLGSNPSPSSAFERDFPDELTDADPDDKSLGVLIGRRRNSQQRKEQAVQSKLIMNQNLEGYSIESDLLPSATWGLALFFATGSRSNPLATPLANLLYDPTKESNKWLQERNEGLFSALPLPFLGLLGMAFLGLGAAWHYALLQLSGGNGVLVGQLAGVALINAGFFEIGRIASGEKGMTADENDRAVQLDDEFDEFASKRLRQGGNCHRSDIVKSFRRYYAKYRVESEEYPLTDREIEQLVRSWNKQKNPKKAEMSSSGFYYGIQINVDADVLV